MHVRTYVCMLAVLVLTEYLCMRLHVCQCSEFTLATLSKQSTYIHNALCIPSFG